VRFTDAHAAASVCSPTRYSFLTGEYAWRNPGADHILSGEAPLPMETSKATVASVLRRAGYATGVVGKWHMGLGKGKPDWNKDIQPGPLELGFDYAFFYPATNDRVPTVYIEDHRVVGLDPNDPLYTNYEHKIGDEPTGNEHPELEKLPSKRGPDGKAQIGGTIVNGISRIGYMTGGKAAWWKDEDIADTLADKAVGFIERNRDRPFFLYFATRNIHIPRVPNSRFKGQSQCGTRCDSIVEFDDSVGKVLSTLDRLNLTDHTLLIISSDNGGIMDDGYVSFDARDANGHRCNGPLRGFKGSLWEGGNREPFLARWPGKIKPGSQSDELLCLTDLMATFAAITGQRLAPADGPDSFNMLPALLGQRQPQPIRDSLVLQASASRLMAIRRGPWKLIPEANGAPPGAPLLFNLADDLGETSNLAAEHPEIVKKLSDLLTQVRERGRSRP
jgi:arylsulfatase A-like enzyme